MNNQDESKEIDSRIKRRIGKGLAIAAVSTMALVGPIWYDFKINSTLKGTQEYAQYNELDSKELSLRHDVKLLEKTLSGPVREVSQRNIISSLQADYAATQKSISIVREEKKAFLATHPKFNKSYNSSLILDFSVLLTSMFSLAGVIYGAWVAKDANEDRKHNNRLANKISEYESPVLPV